MFTFSIWIPLIFSRRIVKENNDGDGDSISISYPYHKDANVGLYFVRTSGKSYNMSDKKFDLDDLRAALITSAGDSGARFKRQLEIDKLGEGITPRLSNDGLNFHCWSKSLIRLVERTHGEKSYHIINTT
ncbi:hypothetical protein O181_120493 [Austropuccinia psidii MF-1]|uniref:Uncharacterized protein n=1 Tax=Austropuccinia psidii MF-1 TaxID=1389203 RepID=A0A9Q3KG42_9BASI|nr:hypothetical protein [Austropuccinia psidii MF-1]